MKHLKKLLAVTSLVIAAYLPATAFANATVYQHCNFKGYKVNLAPGNYDLRDLNARGIRNDDLSSIKVRRGYEIIAYQHHHFTGKAIKLRANDSCLVNNKFNDIISSIKVRRIAPPSRATVYQHCNFGGYRVNLAPGNYDLNQLTRMGIKNDDLSSLKVSRGYEVVAYQHHHFGGKSIIIRASGDKCLVDNRFNDIISSIRVRRATPPPKATVYQHCNFAGYKIRLAPGRYNLNTLKRMGMRNDDLSSMKVPAGYELVAYQHVNFGGKKIVLRGNDSCLVNNGFNDTISSIIFRKR
ncbi:MAG: beta/gamma crystallin-related protein [Leucothrix sp.]